MTKASIQAVAKEAGVSVSTVSRTFTSITNFGTEPVELPGGSVVLTSGPMTPDGQLPTDTSAWVIK